MFTALTKLPRTVWFLGAISFFNDAASDAVYPWLPLFFAATFAVGAQALGVIEGAANATAALMKLVWLFLRPHAASEGLDHLGVHVTRAGAPVDRIRRVRAYRARVAHGGSGRQRSSQ